MHTNLTPEQIEAGHECVMADYEAAVNAFAEEDFADQRIAFCIGILMTMSALREFAEKPERRPIEGMTMEESMEAYYFGARRITHPDEKNGAQQG